MIIRRKKPGVSDDYVKVRDARVALDLENLEGSDKVVLESLDDVLMRVSRLFGAHPGYNSYPYQGALGIEDSLVRRFKKPLSDAIAEGDGKKIHRICGVISEIYTPKNIGYSRRFIDKKASAHAIKTFIYEYMGLNSFN